MERGKYEYFVVQSNNDVDKLNIEYPLLQLLYGNNWKLPIYMRYRQILWKGLSVEDQEYMEFELNYGQLTKQFSASTTDDILNKLDNTIKNEIIKMNVL